VNLLLPLVLFVAPPEGESTDLRPASEEPDPSEKYGPFYEDVAPSDTEFPTVPRKKVPLLSVGRGVFCFVEDSSCLASLLVSADVAAGLAVRSGRQGPDLPYAHYNFRGGFALRPMALARGRWHAWGLGLTGAWSRGTGALIMVGDDEQEPQETEHTDAWRVGLLNQIWLNDKPHAFHVDITVGTVRSNVLSTAGTYELFGTHVEAAFGWGGWGALFVGSDFLDQDTRVVIGFRMHGIAAAPVVGLVLAGMAAGGSL
jgi:hypothetical protein